jgi:hypothetical protein
VALAPFLTSGVSLVATISLPHEARVTLSTALPLTQPPLHLSDRASLPLVAAAARTPPPPHRNDGRSTPRRGGDHDMSADSSVDEESEGGSRTGRARPPPELALLVGLAPQDPILPLLEAAAAVAPPGVPLRLVLLRPKPADAAAPSLAHALAHALLALRAPRPVAALPPHEWVLLAHIAPFRAATHSALRFPHPIPTVSILHPALPDALELACVLFSS